MAQEPPEVPAEANTPATEPKTPTKRRPRRATRPAGTPAPEPTTAVESAPAPVADAAPAPSEAPSSAASDQKTEASEPKKAPARRRAPRAKKVAEPATDAAESNAAPAHEGEEPAPRKPRRRPAQNKAADAAPAPQENAESSKPVVDVLAEFGKKEVLKEGQASAGRAKNELPALDIEIPARPDQEKPARNAAPKGSSAKGSAHKSAAAKGADQKGAGKKNTAHNEAAPSDSAPEAEKPVEVRLPATALLFQAPDIKPVRRATTQRDTAKDAAGPEAANKDVARKDVTSKDAASSEASQQGTEGESAGESTTPAEGAPRRRRRGGRGRRRPQQDQQAEGAATEDAATEFGAEGSAKDSGEADSAKKPASDATDAAADSADDSADAAGEGTSSSRRRRRRRSRSNGDESKIDVVDEVTALKGSTRLEAKRQRRRDGRDAGRRRSIITEAEFLARRESVDRKMVVRELEERTQIAVLEDGVLVEHYVARKSQSSMVGNVYLGRVQNVLPSMEAAFVDLGRGRNAVLYAGEVNWDAAGLDGGQPRRIEQALSSGDSVLVQVTKDPIGHKGARLTSQITLAGRYLVLVPSGAMTGISRKLPEPERARLKRLLKDIVPEGQGVIVRTAAEGATEEELRRDVERLTNQWAEIEKKAARPSTAAPSLLKGEPELATRVVRDIFNEDFKELIVSGAETHKTISEYLGTVAPDLVDRVQNWTSDTDVFAEFRIDEQLAKGMDRKVWLPSGGSLVIDRTEAMTVVDVNTGKFVGSGGTLEETVTRNNLEAAEEIVRQLRLRDIGGIIVIDFIDMVLESNRDLVLRRLVECLGRDRTRHQVAEVTSLGLVQMTRKRVGQGLVEAFSHTCEHCNGRGFLVDNAGDHDHGPAQSAQPPAEPAPRTRAPRRSRKAAAKVEEPAPAEADKNMPATPDLDPEQREEVKATLAAIAAAAASAHEASVAEKSADKEPAAPQKESEPVTTSDSAEIKETSDVPAS